MTLALMRAELLLLRRDTTAWSTAVLLPFLLGGLWALGDPPVGEGVSAIMVLQVVGLLVFTLHTVGTMALAARRDQLVLKRWRSSQATPVSVLIGSIGVPAGLVIAQAIVLSLFTAVLWRERPASVTMLLVGLLAGAVTVGAATFVVAAFTRGPEHAMITTVPVVLGLVMALFWALGRPFDGADLPVLAIPGGATIQLLRLGWDGPDVATGPAGWLRAAAPSLAATLVWAAIATAGALRWFRWEPRT